MGRKAQKTLCRRPAQHKPTTLNPLHSSTNHSTACLSSQRCHTSLPLARAMFLELPSAGAARPPAAARALSHRRGTATGCSTACSSRAFSPAQHSHLCGSDTSCGAAGSSRALPPARRGHQLRAARLPPPRHGHQLRRGLQPARPPAGADAAQPPELAREGRLGALPWLVLAKEARMLLRESVNIPVRGRRLLIAVEARLVKPPELVTLSLVQKMSLPMILQSCHGAAMQYYIF